MVKTPLDLVNLTGNVCSCYSNAIVPLHPIASPMLNWIKLYISTPLVPQDDISPNGYLSVNLLL